MKFNMEKFKEFVKDEPIGLTKPMSFEFTYGCIANSLTINGIEEADLTDAQRRNVIHRIFQWYRKHPEHLNPLLQYFVETHCDDYEQSEPCEHCGDIITTFKLEI